MNNSITKNDIKTSELFDLGKTIAEPLLKRYEYPWEALGGIKEFIEFIGGALSPDDYNMIGDNIWIHKSVAIPPSVCLAGPMIICSNTEVRHGAFFRGNVIIGEGAVAGNSCEFKNSIIFDNAQIPHFNYIGDSIIGFKSHMGASSITSNLKSDKSLVKVHLVNEDIDTGIKKFGAMVGDFVEVGCGSILNPGTIIGKHSNIYPLSSVRGCVKSNSIYKSKDEIVEKNNY